MPFGLLLSWLWRVLAKHWKIVLVVIAAIVLWMVHQHYVHQYGEAQFKKGVDATLRQVRTEVSKRNEVNRAIEDRANKGLVDFAAKKAKEDEARHLAEEKAKEKIAVAVDSVPMWNSRECAVTPQIMSDRNAIRALGPNEGDKK